MLLTLLDDKGFAGRPLENSKKAESQTGWNPWVGCHPQVEKSWRSHLPRDNVVIKYHFCWGIYRDSVVFLLCWREPWNSKTKHIIHIDIYIHRGFPKVSPLNQFWESLRDRLDGWDWMIFINVGMLIRVFTEQPAGCLPFLMGKTPSPATPRIAAQKTAKTWGYLIWPQLSDVAPPGETLGNGVNRPNRYPLGDVYSLRTWKWPSRNSWFAHEKGDVPSFFLYVYQKVTSMCVV